MKTALEFYEKEIFSLLLKLENKEISIGEYAIKRVELFNKAKEMEKQQIIDANIAGMEFIAVDVNKHKEDAEQYYKENFKKNE